MKKGLLKTALLLCALIVGCGTAWADEEATFDFTAIDGFSSWTTSYSEHTVTYDDATVTFASANRQTSTITDQPVTKGQPVSIVMNDGYTISDVTFTCTKWGTKAQTITLHYSTDGGENYTSTDVTSTNFTITKSGLPTGTNAVKITFSSTSNQVGIASASITYSTGGGGGDAPTPIDVEGVTLNTNELDLEVGEEATLTATVIPAEATNKKVTWKSDDETVATVENGKVTAVGVGECMITVTTEDGDFEDFCIVAVKAPAAPSLSFDFTDAAWGFPESYETNETKYTNDGYTFTVGAVTTGGHKALKSGEDVTALIFGKEEGASITFPAFDFNVSKIKVYGNSSASGAVTFNIYSGDDAVSTQVQSSKVTQEFAIDADKQDAGTVYTLKVTNANNCQISKIEVFGYIPLTVGISSRATMYYSDRNLVVAPGAEACTYTVTDKLEENRVYADGHVIPAGTAVVVTAPSGKFKFAITTAEGEADPDNILKGSDAAATTTGGEYFYALTLNAESDPASVGFYWMAANGAAFTNGAHKAYLALPKTFADYAAGVKSFYLLNDDATTGVEVSGSKFQDSSAQFFNLAGQRVNKATKGVFIVNGKKVVR